MLSIAETYRIREIDRLERMLVHASGYHATQVRGWLANLYAQENAR